MKIDVDAVIFDCDGVLFESRRANLAYYNTILRHFGLPEVTEQDRVKAHLCHTAASPRVFEELIGREQVSAALEFASGIDFRLFIPYMDPEPGMPGALASLADRMPLAVATNRGTSMTEILRHFGLGGYFSAVVTSRDVLRPKPHPDMLELAARQLGLAPERLLFVGDSELDRDAAREAGVRFAAYKGQVDSEFGVRGYDELVELICGT